MPARLVLDKDAFLALRHLSLLTVLEDKHRVFTITTYVAWSELCDLRLEIERLEAAKLLVREDVVRKSPADVLMRALKAKGADKGEAEAIAWCACHDPTATFVSLDVEARGIATKHGISAADVFDLVLLLADEGTLGLDLAREKVARWDDPRAGFGRPRDWDGFDRTRLRRRS